MKCNKCNKCYGSGWVWWNELDGSAGHDSHDCIIDDTCYTCDVCNGEGYIEEPKE